MPVAVTSIDVPALPAIIASMSLNAPMTERRPVRLAKSHAASTFGAIDPAEKASSPSAAGVARATKRNDGLPSRNKPLARQSRLQQIGLEFHCKHGCAAALVDHCPCALAKVFVV
jgi:hypothetical protein